MSLFSSHYVKNSSSKIVWRVDSTGIAVIVMHEQKIVYYDFQPITFFALDDRHQYDQMFHHTQMCMNRMIPNLMEHLQIPPQQVTVVIGEPWAHSIRRHIVYKRKTSFKLTRAFIDDLAARDMKKLVQEYRHDAVDFIDPTYHGISIAGHTVSDPWGKSVNDIRFDYLTGFSDVQIVTMIQQTIHEKLKVPLLHIHIDHYQNLLIAFWVKTKLPGGLLVDATGFVTDLYIFHNNQLMQAGTLPQGLSSLAQRVAEELGVYPDELQSLLGLYQKNLINDTMMRRMEQILQGAFQIWEHDFQKFCNHAIEQGDVIDQVIWVGNSNDTMLQFFMHALQHDSLKFPVIFGTNQVGFLHSDALIDTLNLVPMKKLQNQDRIILVGLE